MRPFSCVTSTILVLAFAAVQRPATAHAQTTPHLIVVKLVDAPNQQYAFEPATISAQRGDTVRFVQHSTAPHDVAFRTTPKGAKLGAASTSPYLTADGQTYDLVIDDRFVDGTYAFVCEPHESTGMHGTLTVGRNTK
jgi:plastocyanin